MTNGGAKEYPGTVTVVNTTADPVAKKFRVEIMANNPDLELRPGTFGSAVIEVITHDNALVIPQKAIIDNRYVFLVEGNRAVRKEVFLGLRNMELIEIKEGLKEGDTVVVEGNYGLIDGTQVEVKR